MSRVNTRKFTLSTRGLACVTGVFQVLGGLVLWHVRPGVGPGMARPIMTAVASAMWVFAAAFVLSGVFAPSAAARLLAVWQSIARSLGRAMTVVMFSAIFVFVVPLFLFVRLRDPLRKRLGADSYWEPRPPDDHSIDRAMRPY